MLKLAKHSLLPTTRQITVILDNQGVVKDMEPKKKLSLALAHKVKATNLIKEIKLTAPHTRIAL